MTADTDAAARRHGPLGLVLAAGAGTRMGRPKALVTDEAGSWLLRAVEVLDRAGCHDVLVVLGAGAEDAAALLADIPAAAVTVCGTWQDGIGASLAHGLAVAGDLVGDAAVITLVDLPELRDAAVSRVLGAVGPEPDALGRATYDGRPGHPVVLGREHWLPVRNLLSGDVGANTYLAGEGARLVECGELGGGDDVDSLGAGT